jgi:hypothetical protein
MLCVSCLRNGVTVPACVTVIGTTYCQACGIAAYIQTSAAALLLATGRTAVPTSPP